MASEVDFEAEGLLEGVSGEAREARALLLENLFSAGAELDEVRAAVAEGRLTLLPLERALAGNERFTPREIAERTGVDADVLNRQWAALGMVVGDEDEPTQTREDLEAATRVKAFLDAGLSPEAMAEAARVMAMAMSQVAAANRQMVNRMFAQRREDEREDPENELEVARRLEGLATTLAPLVGPSLEHIYRLQLREQLRHAALDLDTVGAGSGATAEKVAVAFADLVGFTRLGEELPPEEFGRITGRFAELAAEVASGPVRLVKLIGDAAMLTAADAADLAAATLRLVDLVDEEGEGFPAVRAGLSSGEVVQRAGDLYGSPVNRASRITGVARPGSLLVSAEIAERLEGEFKLSDAGSKRLKGIDGSVKVFRCRPRSKDDDEPSDQDGEDAENAPAPTGSGSERRRRRGSSSR